MRYMFIVSGSESFAESGPPPAALHEAVGTLIEEAIKKGTMVSFGGLKPTSTGARMRITNGKIITTDGPFTESKEVIGGFSIYNFASKEDALAELRKFMELHHAHWPAWQGQVELREMYEEEDDVRETQIEGSQQLSTPRQT
jgi:hypothetical protein